MPRGYDEEGEGYVEAEAALEEMDDADAEEREVEETEDLLEYYLQRAAGTRSEAERLLVRAPEKAPATTPAVLPLHRRCSRSIYSWLPCSLQCSCCMRSDPSKVLSVHACF